MVEEVLKADALDRTSLEQASNQRLEVSTDSYLPRELDDILSALDLSQQFDMVSSPERRTTCAHLIEYRSHRPKIGFRVISLVSENFWGHVQGGPTERIG
jgi:hypothetical protein